VTVPLSSSSGSPFAGASREAAPGTLEDARVVLVGCAPSSDQQLAVQAQMLDFVDTHPDALHRTCTDGHLTGSAFVIDHTGTHAVLLLHTKLGKWLQPGGHADGDGHLDRVAWREATEETGLVGLEVVGGPVDLDIHRVEPPGEPGHDHLDVRFVLRAPVDAELAGNHESRDLRWIDVDRISELTEEPGLLRLAAAARRRIAPNAAGREPR
jgi:8-oxo-dGTP pyrophosphatase MutT (NUDIX family)